MAQAVIQPSFAAGELSPSVYARVDLAKYHVGLAVARNFFVDYRGGAYNRAGTMFVGRTKFTDKATRNVRFQFNEDQTYALEFGHLYMRVVKNGGYVLETPKTITAITNANPGVVTSNAHGFSNGDWVFLDGIVGMTELNNKTFIVANKTANNFQLTDLDGNAINTTAYAAYTSGGTAARLFTLVTPYDEADIFSLKFTQSADIVTITHQLYQTRDLTRLAHDNWTLTTISIGSSIAAPGFFSAGSTLGAGTTGYSYVVTAVSDSTGDESVASAHFDLTQGSFDAVNGFNFVAWTGVAGAGFYNIYRAPWNTGAAVPAGSLYGYIGSSQGGQFLDSNIIADYSQTPPENTNPFPSAGYFPAVSTYFQERKMYGGSLNFPETIWASQVTSFSNFNTSTPIRDDDSIIATLASLQVNAIQWFVPMPGGLVVGTTGGIWQVSGEGVNSPITPSSAIATPQGYNGSALLQPLVINFDILYLQASGAEVSALAYNYFANIYAATDTTVLSAHLFKGHTLVDWAYAEEPHKLIWAVRDDGALLCCTYLREQDVTAWTRHDTQGLFKSVCTIQEEGQDVPYFIVRRFIDGQWIQTQERMASRLLPSGLEDSWFVDCGLAYPLTYPSAGVQPSAATGTIHVVADAAVFASGDVGSVFRGGGGIGTVTVFNSSTDVTVLLSQDIADAIPSEYDGQPTTVLPILEGDWSLTVPVTSVSGLDHLEGQMVSILADGSVMPSQTVAGGSVPLNHAASKIVVGLAKKDQLQTLYLDTGEPTIQGRRKKITALTLRVENTRGLKIGSTFSSLVEIKQRSSEPMGTPISLYTGDQRAIMDPNWTIHGQVCIQQDYPLPAAVLGVIPEVTVGDN